MAARPRIATARVVGLIRRSPALAILGARQVGKSTLARLEGMALHLTRTIKTGTFCSYAPDPRAPIEWET